MHKNSGLVNEWQPIDTAPTDPFDKDHWYRSHSERLLLWNGSSIRIGIYKFTKHGKAKWEAAGRCMVPTHWMALPKPPR